MSVTTPIHGKAASDLAFIRKTMDSSKRFTAVSGWGGVGMAAVAFIVAPWANAQSDPWHWLFSWLLAAGLGLVVGTVAIVMKARKAGQPLSRGAGRRFALGLGPPLFVGVLLTLALHSAGVTELLPVVWLLLFGAALTTAGAYSVTAIPAMGLAFLATGTAALLAGPSWGDFFLAAGFGGINLAGGVVVLRRHGG